MASSKTDKESNSGFNFRDYITACALHWKWFLASVIIICGLAYLWVIRKEPQFVLTEQVLIKDEQDGNGADAIASMFAGMGLGRSAANVYNEIITFSSPTLLTQVIDSLDLQTNVIERKFPHGSTLYGSTLPFLVEFPGQEPENQFGFRITVNPDGSKHFFKFFTYEQGKRVKLDNEFSVAAGVGKVRTPIGEVTFSPNPNFTGDPAEEPVTYIVLRSGLHGAVEALKAKYSVDLADRDADVLDLTIKDVNIERARDILTTMVNIYNQDWINDKNRISAATSHFIDDRLALLEGELGSVDSDIMSYKSKSLTPDLQESAKISLQTSQTISADMLKTTNEMAMAQFLKEYLDNPANANAVIPVNTGIGSPQLETQIAQYNALLLTRNNLESSTSASNPLVREYDTQLKGQRQAVTSAVTNHLAALRKMLANMEGAKGQIKSDLSAAPKQAKFLLSVERQQKVKEALYIYLLQKREENELSQKFTADNTRIITPPYGSNLPVSPKKNLVLGIAFLISLMLPAAFFYLREMTNNKVRSRHDLDKMSAPFAGEIPFVGRKKRLDWLRKRLQNTKKAKKALETLPVTVQAGNRDIVNESFRIVRSNIDFMLRDNADSNILMMTSLNPGSGKSFVTYNLAASFAIKNKKALIVDCDLRHGSASQYVGMPHHGLSNYLTGNTDDWQSLVVEDKDIPGLYVLPIGHRPPNPAELLDNGRIGTLLKQASAEYDYVIMDCPPIDVVVDTQILSRFGQLTIFVVRAGLLDRDAVAEIDKMYKENRFNRMTVLLNGTEGAYSRAATYGSSYYTDKF